MNKAKINPNQWKINYFHRQQQIGEKILMDLYSQGLEPAFKEREVKRVTLSKYIEFIGIDTAAKLFDCSPHTVKAWRYGNRQPSTEQAKNIIMASEGKLDFFSIYGPIDEESKDTSEAVE